MSFLSVTDERTGKRVKYVSAKAIDRMVADMQRKQQRILDGKTLKENMPANQFQGLKLGKFPAMVPGWKHI